MCGLTYGLNKLQEETGTKISSLHLLHKKSTDQYNNHKIFRAVGNGAHFIQAHKRSPEPLKVIFLAHLYTKTLLLRYQLDIRTEKGHSVKSIFWTRLLPSWELTYPRSKVLLKMICGFPFGGICLLPEGYIGRISDNPKYIDI